jgi:aryl-alcohol dehydrogenase-like predicted oxidoreductase
VQTTPLGKTGLTVSVAGLGCGGNSQLGLGKGASHDECVSLVREAIDLGVNFIDTAQAYGTEAIVGDAVSAIDRSQVVISTKSLIRKQNELVSAADIAKNIESSLKALKTDYIDVFHLHAVWPETYEHALNEIAPVLVKAKEAGKIRHIGITESGPADPEQKTLARAIHDDPWEVMMLSINMMNQRAREGLLPTTQERGIGTLIMFAVRNIFSQPDVLKKTFAELAGEDKVPKSLAERDNPLDFLLADGGASSIADAAYRYVRHQPGCEVILFGTGSKDHLRTNIESINKGPLRQEDVDQLHALFSKLIGVGLDLPERAKTRSGN